MMATRAHICPSLGCSSGFMLLGGENGVHCFSRFIFNNASGDGRVSEIEDSFDYSKILLDQLGNSLSLVREPVEPNEGWHEVTLIVDPGVCDTVVDTRDSPVYPPTETNVSTKRF